MQHELMVKDLMSTELITLNRDETLDLANEIMRLARIRHLPVIDRDGRLVGLVTHRDLLRAQVSILGGFSKSETDELNAHVPASAIMTSDVRHISPTASALDAARLMRDNKFGCLPVVDEKRTLLGLLTEADFLELVIRALQRRNI